MLLRSIVVVLSALTLTAVPLTAQTPAAPATAAMPEKVSGPELAYWKQLQADISEMRAANLKARIKTAPYEATPEALSAIASRLETFLDRRDQDPVADLGPDFKEYRERLVALVNLALAPVTASARFKSTLETNGEERMMKAMKIYKQVEEIDAYKPKLALLHETVNRRVIASGEPSRFFFQTIGVGDKSVAAGVLGSYEERDAQFLADSAAIAPVFADLAKGNFVANRIKHGLTEGLMDPLIQTVEKFREQFADTPADALEEGLKTAESMQEAPDEFNLKRHVLRLELLRRQDSAAYVIAMQEFQGAFLRWLGKIDEIAPLGLCRDLAVAQDGSWFAYAPSEKTIVVREAATGAVRVTLETEGAVRALASSPKNELLYFTTEGLLIADVTASAPFQNVHSPVKTVFIEPRIASSRAKDRFVFALGIKPGVQRDDLYQTFSVEKSASRVTSVATSADGLTVAYGYAGDNVTGSGDPRYGYDVLRFSGAEEELGKEGGSTTSRQINAPIVGAALSLSMSADGKHVALATFGRPGGSVSFDDLTTDKLDRKILTIEAEPYHWVHLLEGNPMRVIAGSRTGNVRVWNATSRELLASFSVPAGGDGVVFGVLGDDLLSAALGQPGVHRWKIADGSLLASYEGDVTAPDVSALASRLAAERELIPARETLIAALDAEDNAARVKAIEILRGDQAKQLDALGQRQMVDRWFAAIRADQVIELGKSKRALEAFELGYKEISTGVLDPHLVYITLYAANRIGWNAANADVLKRVLAIGEQGIALYPTEVAIHQEYRKARSNTFASQAKIPEALKEVDELDLIDPSNAPHAGRRYDIYMVAYNQADKAGRKKDAMQTLIDAMDYAEKPADRLMLADNIFAISYELKDWQLAVNAANMVLQMDEKRQQDQNFMAAARYAYQMANPKK